MPSTVQSSPTYVATATNTMIGGGEAIDLHHDPLLRQALAWQMVAPLTASEKGCAGNTTEGRSGATTDAPHMPA